ncbi:LEAF RUST 10 DISEASE-RESISTANCE LOCUS RECEPTOR-LIKE PROTEIN KINASE-like 2.4 [Vicia villosa]|uniref:LEAF RUST 10 DISEASE-RESISTANCE LOCUS RECEPTOR-LIKE PROTEIN KINASE-like 2.4 n=1 Tax=Vicia villosa TaxID=3911 RepID=UPI00273C17A0|nr:LEAF RUST 10 DISEASE-RESISTANCE LOCUS RECEPTOR-LIKE PROTEIN KINASE-like 2.4 [Vicia villosa]
MSFLATLNRVVAVVLLLLILSYKSYGDEQQDSCSQRCGVHNITHPFRLKNSPKHCGDERYNLSCENNNQLMLYYNSVGKYHVQSINYNNFTIRLLDFNYSNYSILHPLGSYNFTSDNTETSPYQVYGDLYKSLVKPILYLNCPNRVQYSEDIYFPTPICINISDSYPQQRNSSYVNSIKFGYDKSLSRLGLEDGCRIEFMYLTSWGLQDGNNNMSCTDIRSMMLYGFELSWLNSLCKDGWSSYLDENGQHGCDHDENWSFLALVVIAILIYIGMFFGCLFGVKIIFGVPSIVVLLIYKWRQKHLSIYDGIEDFLQSDNNIIPLRYSYKDIKKITEKFKTKLGHGGYGSVFKGKLRSGRLVAVKLLDRAKSNNGQDFVNEVVTIGRIHHVNVVQLIGFCMDGSKRALIYEFMPNGSLEKYIHSHIEERHSLSCEKLYFISLGVARGIDYLHNGCNMKILHFDIKPHNILLDENFNPKVSDFGLARLYSTDKSIVTLTAARGTIGYMAPELFYRNVGTISYKADVYSFGMLLMEMASRRKNLNALADQSSQIYFPFWIYDQLHDGREITTENDTDQEMKLAKKMMIVALWCIQTKPEDRPSMNKVLEMLEEDDEDMQIPSKPYFCLQDHPVADVKDDDIGSSWTSYGTTLSDPKEPT